MALSTIEEERKRKEAAAKQLTPTTDPFLASMARGDYTKPKLVDKQANPTPGNVMSESFYGGADYSPRTRPQIGQSQPDGSRLVIDQRASTQSANIKPPTLKEIPNAQRDADLGKMTLSSKGNISTYDFGGGNIATYDRNQKARPTLKNINNQPNGVKRLGNMDISFDSSVPKEIQQEIMTQPMGKQPTWDDYHAQQKARYDAYVNSPRGRYFGVTPQPTENTESEPNSFGELFMQGIQNRKDRFNAQRLNDLATQDINRAEAMTQANRNSIMADANRISEMEVRSQNKLRDIEGEVTQRPTVTENPYKPIVIEEPDPRDPTGNTKRQRIMINPDGKGYVDGMPSQKTYDESQSEIIAQLSKMRESKDPRLAAAEAKYKAVFGNLPY